MNLSELFNYLKADLLRILPLNAPLFLFAAYTLHPRFLPVLFFRVSRLLYCSKLFWFLSPLFTWINMLAFGIEITPKSDIGPGLFLPHTSGTVIGANKIGSNATIFQGVTIGSKLLDMSFDINKRPELGSNVIVGAGAKVLGNLTIGNDVVIGANSVVTRSIISGQIVAGVPAKPVRGED